jgi:hypothetical protein
MNKPKGSIAVAQLWHSPCQTAQHFGTLLLANKAFSY